MSKNNNEYTDRLSLSVAGLALIISIISFYYQFLNKESKLYVTVPNFDILLNDELVTEPVLMNKGTESVVVMNISYFLKHSNSETETQAYSGVTTEHKGPFVLSPGESLSIELSQPMRVDYFGDFEDGELNKSLDVIVRFNFVDANIESVIYEYELGTLTYNLKNGNYSYQSLENKNYVDLFNL